MNGTEPRPRQPISGMFAFNRKCRRSRAAKRHAQSGEGVRANDVPRHLKPRVGAQNEEILRIFFDLFNINGARSINAQDLGRYLRALGFCPLEHELQDAIAKFHSDGNDGLRFGEFVQLWYNISAESVWQDCIIERAFEYFDMDQTGAMPQSMLKSILVDIGEPLATADVDSLLRVMDSSDDGIFFIQDFMKACSSKSRAFARGKLLALEPHADKDRGKE